jgi:hypothetical protein
MMIDGGQRRGGPQQGPRPSDGRARSGDPRAPLDHRGLRNLGDPRDPRRPARPPAGRARTLAPLAVLAVVGLVAAAVAYATLAGGGGNYQAATAQAPAELRAGAAPTPKRVLIFGDSIAAQAGGAAEVALEEAGVEVRVVGLWGQGMFTRGQYDMGATNPDPPTGSVMAAADQAVADFRPDVIAVSLNHNYWPPYPRDAGGAPIERGSEEFSAMARAQLTELVRRLSVVEADIYLVDPIPEGPDEGAADNPIWNAYLSVQDQLGFGVIRAGDAVAGPNGGRVEEMADCRGHNARVRPAEDIHLTYYGAGLVGTATARELASLLGVTLGEGAIAAPSQAPAAILPMGTGYRLVTCDAASFRFGAGGTPLDAAITPGTGGAAGLTTPDGAADPVVGATATPDGRGAWLVTASGRVLARGGATAAGQVSLAGGDRAVGIAAAPSGTGYWVATAAGDVQAMGGAADAGGLDTGEQVVAIAAAPGGGYWLLTAAGRVAAFGGAEDFGGLGSDVQAAAMVSLAAHPAGGGYWALDRAGGVHAFGSAADLGSAVDQPLAKVTRFVNTGDFDTVAVPPHEVPTEAVAMLPTPTGEGYWVTLANGAVCSFGDAPHIGGIHRSEVDQVLLLKGAEYYGDGPCRQDAGFGPPNKAS